MAGRLYAVIGPDGAGKETLMAEALRRRRNLRVVRRIVTRPPDPANAFSDSVSREEFLARKAGGEFVLDWETAGICYGIPTSIDIPIAEGRDVLFSASRGVLGKAWESFPGLSVILVTASVPVLAGRLAARSRESRDRIAERLARGIYEMPCGPSLTVVENDGALEPAITAFLAALRPERA